MPAVYSLEQCAATRFDQLALTVALSQRCFVDGFVGGTS